MKTDIHWVDNIKLIGILAVILGHMNSPIGGFIFSWHMPLFFMIAGFFIKVNVSPKEFFKKDFRRLMIPYFIFSLLGLAVEAVKRMILHRDQLTLVHEIKGIFFDMNYEGLHNHYGFVLWFLPTLFLARMAIYFLYRHRYQSHALSAAFVGATFGVSFFVHLPFAIDHAMNALLWVWLGYLLFPHFQKKAPIPVTLIMLLSTLGFLFLFRIPGLNMAEGFYSNISLNVVWPLLIISTMIFCLNRYRWSASKNWANETMLLFIFHPYTNNVAHLIGEKVAPEWWALKFLISLILLQSLMFIKVKFKNRGVFKYV